MTIQLNRLLIFPALILPVFCLAQNQAGFSNTSIGFQGHYGSFITSLTRSIYIKDSYSCSGELSYIRQTNGSKPWQMANGLPRWGLAAFFGNSGSRTYIGSLGGVFSFIDFRLLEINRFRSGFRAGGGLGFIEKPYNAITNHKNLLLGSRANIYLNFLWKNELRVTNHIYFNAGLSFSHLSNGRITLPNLGLNTPAISAGLRYSIHEQNKIRVLAQDSFSHKTGIQLFASIGFKQVPTAGGDRFLVKVFTAEAGRQFAAFGRYGCGLLLSYDGSAGNHYSDTIVPRKEVLKKPFNPAFFISYEQLLGKFSIPVQMGVYLAEHYFGETLFQSFGIRYQLNRHWLAGIQLKTHFGHADFIHTGIGYRF